VRSGCCGCGLYRRGLTATTMLTRTTGIATATWRKRLILKGISRGPRRAMMAAALSGVVTFLFTDVEGSILVGGSQTRTGCGHPCWRTNDVLRTAIGGHGGFLFEHTGDGVCAEFSSPKSAVDAAVVAQGAL